MSSSSTSPFIGWVQRHAAWCLAAVVGLVYLPSLPGGFLPYDDTWLVEDNPVLRAGASEALSKIWFDLSRETRLVLGAEYLPLRDLSYFVDRQVLGLGAPGMRAEQVGLYAGAVLMLRAALVACLPSRLSAELASACFALHPVHVESVAWIAGRKDVLAMFFVAAALWAYEGRRASAWAAVPLLACAHLSKSMSVIAVGLLLAQDLLARRRPRLGIVGASLAVALLSFGVHYVVGERVSMLGGSLSGDRWAAFCTMGQVWLEYVSALLWPPRLAIVHETPRREALGILGGLGWSLLAGVAIAGALRLRQGRPFLLGAWLWAVLPLVPVSQVLFPLENIMADRYLWLSVLGLGLALPWLWQGHLAGRAVVLAWLLGLLGASAWRAALFGDGAELFDRATRSTRGALAPYLLAQSLERRGDAAGAEGAYRLAIERTCEAPCEPARRASNNLARLLVKAGRAEHAEPVLRQAMQRFPEDPKIHFNLVRVLERLGRGAEARALYDRSVAQFPQYVSRAR